MIQKLEVMGLNHQFDYGLKFNPDLNIFTGSNGCGKTTLLKLVWYLISGNLQTYFKDSHYAPYYWDHIHIPY